MLRQLDKHLGIRATLDTQSGRIEFEAPAAQASTRKLGDLATLGLLYTKGQALSNHASNTIVTRLYRYLNDVHVRRIQGIGLGSEGGVKFDVTVLLSHNSFGDDWNLEFPKTTGHYHTPLPGSTIASPDFYQVVYGSGIILLQHVVESEVCAYAVEVAAGTTVLIPPQFAHITINTGDCPLVFANVCVRQPHLNYEDIYNYGGGAFYFLRNGTDVEAIENPGYLMAGNRIRPLGVAMPHVAALQALGVEAERPIYEHIPDKYLMDVLCRPDRHASELNAVLSLL